MTDQPTASQRKQNLIYRYIVCIMLCLCMASIPAEIVLGAGLGLLFVGLAVGIHLTATFYRFLVKD